MNNKCIINTQQLTYISNNKLIVDNVNIEVNQSDIITIIGPNGAGKTTLIKLLLGLLSPTSGAIWRKHGLKIGYMPQKTEINQLLPLSVKQFLYMHHKMTVFEQSISETLAKVGALHLLDYDLQKLSGGEWQRVLLARALLKEPDLLILDEPVQGVDVIGQSEFYNMLSVIKNDIKCAIVMVSHDLHLVIATTDQVICLNKHVCCHGHPQKVIQDPHYLQLFGDSIKNIAPYVHHHDHSHNGNCEG